MAKTEKKQDETAEVTEEVVTEPAEEIKEEAQVDTDVELDTEASDDRTTKAGKRSAKAQREADEEEARKEAAATKSDKADEPAKPRVMHKPNPLKRHGKAYRAAEELVDKTKFYELTEAVQLTKDTAKTKFDASVELHMNLGVDPRQADQMVRATVTLPAGSGKKLRIAVLAPTDKHDEAKKAGADIVSDGDLIDQIDKGKLDFDVLVSTPDMMARLSKVARVLGPRGLMPNPKSGTVTPKVGEAVEQSKAGRVEFRVDKQAIVHLAVGKASFEAGKLEDNVKAAIDAVLKAKPATAKGTYVKAISLATSMGPGIKIDVQKAIAAAHVKR
jgi:large subunit ribosomal protein L1